MNLTAQNVENIFNLCLYEDGENTDNAIRVEGIICNFGFNPEKIVRNKANIETMLSELPKEFHENEGGGWTFLNACDNNKGAQWTGAHQIMEQLFCLGMAIKKVKYLMPREMWKVLPGGMPYLVVMQ